jgi:hypothetical protein
MLHRTAKASLHGIKASGKKGLATAVDGTGRIGDTKVAMSLLEPSKYINYQRIEDNLEVVRKRSVPFNFSPKYALI